MRITDQDKDQARALNVVDVVRNCGVELKQKGREWIGVCPFHDDGKPSLRVHPDRGWRCDPCGEGKDAIGFVMKYYNVEFPEAVARILGNGNVGFIPPLPEVKREVVQERQRGVWEPIVVTDLAKVPKPPTRCKGVPVPVGTSWDYLSEEGHFLQRVCRFELKEGKTIRPLVYCRNTETREMAWQWKGLSGNRPLYGLPKLAANPNALVLVVEGEKTADAARQHFVDAGKKESELVVVTWPCGTTGVDHTDFTPLHDRNVLLWPDNDLKGYPTGHPQAGDLMPLYEQVGGKAMLTVFGRIEGIAKKVRFVIPPKNARHKWDLADEFPDGFTLREHLKKNSEHVVMAETIKAQADAARAAAAALAPPPKHGTLAPLVANNAQSSALRFGANWIDDAWEGMKANDWLVDGIIERDSTTTLFGEPGHGKSFLALSLAVAVATGTAWFGRDVEEGAVFCMAGEGLNGILRRVKATEMVHGVSTKGAPLALTNGGAALADKLVAKEVAAVFRRMSEERGVIPSLIVIDTLARNFGADENSTEDMNRFIANLDMELRRLWKCAILIVHHTGKDSTRGARGSSALKGAVDAEYQVIKGEDGIIRMHCNKMKDAESPAPMAFRLQGVELPIMDKKGRKATSAAVVSCDFTDAPQKGKQARGKNQAIALQVLRELEADHKSTLEDGGYDPAGARVKESDWREQIEERGLDRSRYREVKSSLLAAGMIAIEGSYVRTSGLFA